MATTTGEQSALEELAAARLRGAKPEKLLELSEAAIDQATATGDTPTIELVAAQLDSAAAAHPDPGDGLRLQFAARRAHAIASQPPAIVASEDVPERVPEPAKKAFRLTGLLLGAIVVLALLSAEAVAIFGDVSASYLIIVIVGSLVLLGLLFAALTGAVGIGRWFQGKRRAD